MKLTDEHRRLLTMLAGCPTGATDYALTTVHNFSGGVLYDLVHENLARVMRQHIRAGGLDTSVHRFWISESGKQAIGVK